MELGRQLSTKQHEEDPEVGLRNDGRAECVKIWRGWGQRKLEWEEKIQDREY